MAASYEKLGDWENSAKASQSCIQADNKFVKGYFRLATAQKALNNLAECIKVLQNGLGVDPSNNDLKKMKKDVIELQRGEQVAKYCTKASEQMQSGDLSGAFKTLDMASRLDAGNPDIDAMMKKVRPKYEAQERARKSGLSSTEKYKEEGDTKYKAADFEGAIVDYTKCLKALGDNSKPLAIKCLSNRSACFKQISNFDGTIEDCSGVLEVEPNNVKALVRRSQAFEAVERYKFALQDVKTVLTMPRADVGEANFTLCNGMQHRLNKVVAQLKAMN
jgi:stress-induced-phosphoprotein 1